MMRSEDRGPISVLWLEHGKANALDLDLIRKLARELERIEQSDDITAMVFTGSGSIFSAGVDLHRVIAGGSGYVAEFLPAFGGLVKRLFTFVKPVVMAVNGHAIAGGCVLVQTGDHRIMATGKGKVGVPELLVGVPFPAVALEALRFGIPPCSLQDLVYTGRTIGCDDALELGAIDELVDPGDLLDRAIEVATRLAAIPAQSFQAAKLQLRSPSLDTLDRHGSSIDDEVLRIWKQPDTFVMISRYMEETVSKKKA